MATSRGSIAKLNADGSVTAIYVHCDSYLSGVGQILVNHYTDVDKIDQLMALGDLSSLGEQIGCRRIGDSDSQYRSWCTAYGRDRGEQDCEAGHYQNVEQWLDWRGQEYNYVWDGSEWLVNTQGMEFRSVVQCLLETSS